LKTAFKASFVRDLKSLRSKRVRAAVAQLIEAIEQADNLKSVPNVKKLQGEGSFYRIRVGDYRVGVTVSKGCVTFVRCLDRKAIYRYFP